jgi:peptidoglycan/LPS O-acetylase OafA/YrhL
MLFDPTEGRSVMEPPVPSGPESTVAMADAPPADSTPPGSAASRPVPESSYRGDIQGLRAVAVLLVALNHAGIPFLGGGYIGVDVFFVVSGFLITGLLLKDRELRGRISLLDFYTRRARRILPAAALTLVATDLAAWLLLNFVRGREAVIDSLWAALFAANVQFERIGADYFASAQPPSPVQHYWSLAVEEQFYVLWPALLILALAVPAVVGRLQRRSGDGGAQNRGATAAVLTVLVVAIVASLAWSIRQTAAAPADAYFSALTRAWELGVGAALAVGVPLIVWLPRTFKAVLSWVGVAGILLASTWFSATTPFPGWAALLPVLSTAMVLVGGTGLVSSRGAGLVLGTAPFRFVGDVSYSFYLWHWPFLIIAADYLVKPLSVGANLLLLGAAFVTSVVTYLVYENPLRRSRTIWRAAPVRGLYLWPASILAVVLVSALALHSFNATAASGGAGPAVKAPADSAAAVVQVEASVQAAASGSRLPSPLNPPVGQLVGSVASNLGIDPGCILDSGATNEHNPICPVGNKQSSKTMVVVGDSHAQMWLPGLAAAAQMRGWKLIPLVHNACGARYWGAGTDAECTTWFTWVSGEVGTLKPNLVVIGSRDIGTQQEWTAGLKFGIHSLESSGARVVLMGDAPGLGENPVDCLLAPGATMRSCTFPLDAQLSADAQTANQLAAANGAGYVDVLPWFCSSGRCPAVIGSTIAYLDQTHVSQAYSKLLAAPLAAAVKLG